MQDQNPITNALRTLFEPGDVFEIRVLDAVSPGSNWTHTESGYFEYDQIDIVPNVLANFRTYGGVYVTMNPVNPDLLARANNRLKPAKNREGTSDNDILQRRWMLVDIDPVRPAGISATKSEKVAAFALADQIASGLSHKDWPEPIFVDSGNGTQLLYRVDLPADDGGLVQRCLKVMGTCSDEKAEVDLSVHNAARICRLPGTWNRKGDEIPERPHRMAEILLTPDHIRTVSTDKLVALAGALDSEPETATKNHTTYTSNLVADDFGMRGNIAPILIKHGWTLKFEGDQQHWYRPGKTLGQQSATYNGEVFYVFSNNAEPFEPRKGYSRFGVYAMLEHGGDFAAATQALSAQGYGPRDDVDLSGLLASLPRQDGVSRDVNIDTDDEDDDIEPLFSIRAGDIEIKPPQWLLRGMIEQDSFAMIFGEPGAGKSFVAIDWSCRIATGMPWRGHHVKQGAVYYLAGEGQSGIGRRFQAWALHNGVNIKDKDVFVVQAISATNEIDQRRLHKMVRLRKREPTMIVIDTLARNFGEGDENSTQDMSRFVAACDAIRNKYQCTLLVVHHSGHSDKGRARGAIALKAALDAEYQLVKKGKDLLLTSTKMKDAEIPAPLAMELDSIDLPGVFDDYGEQVTSAAVEIIDANIEAIVSQVQSGSRSKWQKTGLDIANSIKATEGTVEIHKWHDACAAVGMPRATRYRVLEKLCSGGLIAVTEESIEVL
ncbi:MAG: helicase RepA family protein [Planctomycetia bacterium]|jgi:hypothetical protein